MSLDAAPSNLLLDPHTPSLILCLAAKERSRHFIAIKSHFNAGWAGPARGPSTNDAMGTCTTFGARPMVGAAGRGRPRIPKSSAAAVSWTTLYHESRWC